MVIPRYSNYYDYDVNGIHFNVNLFYGKASENAKICYEKSFALPRVV